MGHPGQFGGIVTTEKLLCVIMHHLDASPHKDDM
jgi:hypothetical protein